MKRKKEIWKDIIGLEGLYQISNHGNMRSLGRQVPKWNGFRFSPGKNLRQVKRGEYLSISASKNGVAHQLYVHRLVGLHFVPNPDNKPQIGHNDGNKTNNYFENLRWETQQENIEHAIKTGLINQNGVNNHQSKLSELDISNIKQLLATGKTHQSIATVFGVSRQTIGYIKNNLK